MIMSRQHIVKDAVDPVVAGQTSTHRYVVFLILQSIDGEVRQMFFPFSRVPFPLFQRLQKVRVGEPKSREQEPTG